MFEVFDILLFCFASVDVVWGVERSEIDIMFYEGYESSSSFVCSVTSVLWHSGGFVVVGKLHCCYVYDVGLHDVCQFCEFLCIPFMLICRILRSCLFCCADCDCWLVTGVVWGVLGVGVLVVEAIWGVAGVDAQVAGAVWGMLCKG